MNRQTLRDWGTGSMLRDQWRNGSACCVTADQQNDAKALLDRIDEEKVKMTK
ncbi:hypothetical protein [Komagataeibacter medellinensis]|uniref:hypothetical protein n=1 Tax=Komagataeibacter medellinensis TaxID=1177712 RepID=UPI0003A7F023|nr:hypothetical protein [Komagataeibacter medellinensis]